MFEKSLYDLIRGLRNHKGNEKEYIQNSLRECRNEIRGSDMDLKATALLKLIYLEMFGHDMSWASFNVLEVMSSAKYLQKRVGYLGAVQSFRPDTEVLMLATNLLKKDISSPLIPTIALPLTTLPHIITPSLSESLLIDLMPRLSHSNPSIRKKTVVTLYRLALSYPDTLRPAWPKIKEMLMDTEEDPSVTAAVINVVCELGWRRPRDFLPLAPRLFTLLVDGGNNWMAIKIIKLFAILTPLEPRLIRKLLPPLVTLIRTTPAMSLLYECINGIIQGGILEDAGAVHDGDDIAELCVKKLQGMIAVEGDPNLKYVALLAFNKIVTSHPQLVSVHQDVIVSCIDDHDISIRLQALDLISGMINGDNLTSVVEQLMRQLRQAASQSRLEAGLHADSRSHMVEPTADSEGENPEETLKPSKAAVDDDTPMPDDYRITIIRQILNMCSRDTYSNIRDFEWYIEVLDGLVKLVPSGDESVAVSTAIGSELRNVAVRVSAYREEAVKAASGLLIEHGTNGGQSVLAFAAWVVGEYPSFLLSGQDTLSALLAPAVGSFSAEVLYAYVQAIPKVLASVTSEKYGWSAERQSITSLLLARTINFLEPLAKHPNLEVQERSVEFLELMRIAAEAVANHSSQEERGPLLLTGGLPSLFNDFELNPVAATAQRRVPLPDNLDLSTPINSRLTALLERADKELFIDNETAESERFYYQRADQRDTADLPAQSTLRSPETAASYQYQPEVDIDPTLTAKQRAQRRARNRDDPFYIGHEDDMSSGVATPLHDILKNSNGQDVDIDSIPIMDLDLGDSSSSTYKPEVQSARPKRKHWQNTVIMAEENIDSDVSENMESNPQSGQRGALSLNGHKGARGKRSLLEVDSSGIGSISLDDNSSPMYGQLELERRELETAEMAKALAEVERLRMEMQRASERIRVAEGIPMEGTMIKRKKKKKKAQDLAQGEDSVGGEGLGSRVDDQGDADVVVKKKKKKRKAVVEVGKEMKEQA
jgi:AP-3 complex subunit delta-1